MRFTLRILGAEVFHVDTDPDADEDDDKARDLSGGTTTADRIEAGPDRSLHGLHPRT